MFLILINRAYHFRLRVPLKLNPILGRYELRATLRTSSVRQAQPIASRLAHDCQYLFTRLRLTPETILMKLDMDTLNRILRNLIEHTIDHDVDRHVNNGSRSSDTLRDINLLTYPLTVVFYKPSPSMQIGHNILMCASHGFRSK